MDKSLLSRIVPGLLSLALVACSGGGGSSTELSLRCSNGAAFCLVSCDLGCTQLGGCTLSEIAENQTLKFLFNQNVLPASVNGSSFSIRTLAGQPPEGEFRVNGREVQFVPRITVSNGISRFGFQRNETYVLTVVGGGGPASVRSVSGDALGRDFTCTLAVTQGIIDLDRAPPRAELVLPTTTTNVPLDATIVLRFSELIDTGPFLGSSTQSIPIRYQLKRTRSVGGALECDTTGAPLPIEGTVRLSVERVGTVDVTVISMKPSVPLPGPACVEVVVSGDVRDLAGVAAIPVTFTFITEAGTLTQRDLVENFATPANLDTQISSGVWNGGAQPGLIGGPGRHGSFDITAGSAVGGNIYEWDTDNLTIPPGRTLSGLPEQVTDGRFYFSDFVLPEGFTLRFKGSKPARVFVRGRADISGTIEMNAPPMTNNFTILNQQNNIPTNIVPGQPGGAGVAGGGRGGRGGDRCTGAGPRIISGVIMENGQPGEDVRLPSGHAYLTRAGNTGGPGSPLYPAAGTNGAVTYTVSFAFCGQSVAGGGGGGFSLAGGQGTVPTPAVGGQPSPPNPGGVLFDLFPIPPGASSLDHFLVGGSGGGGGGSHPFLALTAQNNDIWRAGAGGSGGGGAAAVRSGSDLIVRAQARLEARGGAGAFFSDRLLGIPSPGGGGSGGSFVLQSGTNATFNGTINTSGGNGSSTGNVIPANLNAVIAGGPGSAGFFRIEAANTATVTPVSTIPAFDPARHRGPLTDRDDVVGCASLYYSTQRVFPPTWQRYVLEVDPGNGSPVLTFSDDPAVSANVANTTMGPVQVLFQGARVSTTTGQPLPNTQGLWRDALRDGPLTNINSDQATGVRFLLLFNRRDFPNAVVRRLVMTYEG